LHDNWSFGFREVPFVKTEMISTNTQNLQFCERAFRVIRFTVVFSQTLHEPTDRCIKLRHHRNFASHYHIIIHKSFNYSSKKSDMLYLEFVIGTTN